MKHLKEKFFFTVLVLLISVTVNAQQREVTSDGSRSINQLENKNNNHSGLRINTASTSEKRELLSTEDNKKIKRSDVEVEDTGHGEQPSIRRDPTQINRRDDDYKNQK